MVIDSPCFRFSSFKKIQSQPRDISKGVSLIEMKIIVTGETRKQSRIDFSITGIEFHSSTIKLFIDALMKEISYTFH